MKRTPLPCRLYARLLFRDPPCCLLYKRVTAQLPAMPFFRRLKALGRIPSMTPRTRKIAIRLFRPPSTVLHKPLILAIQSRQRQAVASQPISPPSSNKTKTSMFNSTNYDRKSTR